MPESGMIASSEMIPFVRTKYCLDPIKLIINCNCLSGMPIDDRAFAMLVCEILSNALEISMNIASTLPVHFSCSLMYCATSKRQPTVDLFVLNPFWALESLRSMCELSLMVITLSSNLQIILP